MAVLEIPPHCRNIELDDFQKEAIEYLQDGYDVLVSAPTGSGKTLIAEVRIYQLLKENKRVWYASPLKALSNDKYREFRRIFSPEAVGILTGDRKENTRAPVLVGTTEIFRNILIEEGMGNDIDVDLIVFDEAHWIKDKERGVSWEESIIFSPKRAQVLMLSATFPNIEEIALWVSRVREKEVRVVYKLKRPVPLVWYSIGKKPKPLFRGQVSDELTRIRFDELNFDETEFSLNTAIRHIQEMGVYPAIFFVNSRKEAEESAKFCKDLVRTTDEEVEKRAEFCESYYQVFPYLRDDELVADFIQKGVAPHHAGLLPPLKLLFEDALKAGLMKFVFATKTLASGIDVPAKSVVITSQRTFDGQEERLLLPSEVFQIAGRAGRRGKDDVGYVFIAAPITQTTKRLFEELEPIRSSFYVNPHLVLNLLKKFDVEECINLIRKNLKFFEIQSNFERWKREVESLENIARSLRNRFEEIRPKDQRCSLDIGILYKNTVENLRGSEQKRDRMSVRVNLLNRILRSLEASVHPENGNSTPAIGSVAVALDQKGRLGLIILEDSENGKHRLFISKEGRRVLKEGNFTLLTTVDPQEERIFKEEIMIYFSGKHKNLADIRTKLKRLISNTRRAISGIEQKNRNRIVEMERYPCSKCQVREQCISVADEMAKNSEKLERLKRENPDTIEMEFRATLVLLKDLGYLDQRYLLTEKGWEASKLKNPRSIYIFEALCGGFFGNNSAEFSATMAVALSEPKPPFRRTRKDLEGLFEKIYRKELSLGLPPKVNAVRLKSSDRLLFLDGRIYEATFMWAKGATIEEVEDETGVEPGDFSRMIVQTVEVLRQVENIYGYREIAKRAVERIYRSPISDFAE